MSARHGHPSPAGGPRTILVVGATGARGGSVARHLLDRGFAVRALTRDPASERAAALRHAGAEPVAGDLADRPSLRAALAGCWGVFAVVPGAERAEVRAQQGRNLIHAMAGSELEHVVLALATEAETELGAYARSLGLPATYLEMAAPAPADLGPLAAEVFERPGGFVDRTLTV